MGAHLYVGELIARTYHERLYPSGRFGPRLANIEPRKKVASGASSSLNGPRTHESSQFRAASLVMNREIN